MGKSVNQWANKIVEHAKTLTFSMENAYHVARQGINTAASYVKASIIVKGNAYPAATWPILASANSVEDIFFLVGNVSHANLLHLISAPSNAQTIT